MKVEDRHRAEALKLAQEVCTILDADDYQVSIYTAQERLATALAEAEARGAREAEVRLSQQLRSAEAEILHQHAAHLAFAEQVAAIRSREAKE